MDRRCFVTGSLASSLLAAGGDAFGQSGPLTRIIFPFAAGGGGDALCRLIAQAVAPTPDRTIIVENRTGGRRVIGINAAEKAPPHRATLPLPPPPTPYLLPTAEAHASIDPNALV